VRRKGENSEWKPCDTASVGTGIFETITSRLLVKDHFSPILAHLLFPDLFQQVLPIAVGRFDRSLALEQSVESAWDEVVGSKENPFRAPFLEHWSDAGAAPALVVNTFEIESGNRMLISPFYMSLSAAMGQEWTKSSWFYDQPVAEDGSLMSPRDDEWWEDRPPVKQDVKLSTALGLSARFPWLLPAGTFKRGDARVRLVDGGYFENSGAETAYDIVSLLNAIKMTPLGKDNDPALRNFRIYFLAITGQEIYRPATWFGFGDLLSPIKGLLASRGARGGLAVFRAIDRITGGSCSAGTIDCVDIPQSADMVELDQDDLQLPLGFFQSRASLGTIAAVAGRARDCEPEYEKFVAGAKPLDDGSARRVYFSTGTNSCTACSVARQLQSLEFARSKLLCN
jgi:hypothetical protein